MFFRSTASDMNFTPSKTALHYAKQGLLFSLHYFELLALWKGTLICIHFACLPAPRAPFEVKLDHHIPHCSTCLPLSCGKSVAETQLSIIWEDWLLPVMLINNEMGNLTASRSLSRSLSLLLWNGTICLYRWRIVCPHRQQQTLFDSYTSQALSPRMRTHVMHRTEGAPVLGWTPLIGCEHYPLS